MKDRVEDSEKPQEPEIIYGEPHGRIPVRPDQIPFKDKLIFGALLAGGIIAGTVLFLFFLTLFIYVFLPLSLVLILWNLIKNKRLWW